MSEVGVAAFFSYAHSDNDREGGRILRLAEHIRGEFETLTGTTIELFDDSEGIGWGDDFRQRLDEALQKTTFFIPVLTATYFLREECRKEMVNFVSSAKSLGLEDLMLSIRYAPVPDLREDSTDELKAISASMQYESWEALRLVDEGSAAYRTGVNKLAERLVDLTQRLESTPTVTPSVARRRVATRLGTNAPTDDPVGDENDDNEPGVLDLLADVEPAMAAWTETISEFPVAFEPFNAEFNQSTTQMREADSRPNSFAAKILIARDLASKADPHLEVIERLAKDYAAGLMRLDPAIRALLELISEQPASDEASSFLGSVKGLIESSREAMSGVGGSVESAREAAKMSRDLRPILRRFEAAMRTVLDGQSVIDGWDALAERAEGAS